MALNRDNDRGLGRLLMGKAALTVGLGLAGTAAGDAADNRLNLQTIEIEQAIELKILDDVEVAVEDEDFLNIQPGFMLPMADDDLAKQVAAFNRCLDDKDWGTAFRMLTDLGDSRLDVMVPNGDDGLYMAVQVQVQKSLLAMPTDGRRAFQLYFDGQAREMLAQVRNHPRPGSDEQLSMARKLVDRMLASSVGGEAADLLGDLCFERGQFSQARRCWKLALDHGSAAGQNELQLQSKIVMALLRGGEQDSASVSYHDLSARYGKATVRLGGEEVDALDTLGAMLGAAAQRDKNDHAKAPPPLALPKNGSRPAWHLTFVSDAVRARHMADTNHNHYYYRGIQDLQYVVPEVVADEAHVYFQWLGTVFALDRNTGKIKWIQGSITESAKSLNDRMSSNAGNPQNYRIASGQDTLLVTNTVNYATNTNSFRDGGTSQFTITAYEKVAGGQLWNSQYHRDWALTEDGVAQNDTSVIGQVLVAGEFAYAVVHRSTGADCFLRRFDPKTGEVSWTMPLGAADPVSFEYSNTRRMPQPQMLLSDGLLYVLLNNGSLVAVDVAGVEIAWARRLSQPMGVGQASVRGSQTNLRSLEAADNPNGSGQLLLHNRTLYAKEHLGKELVAVDPFTGELKWSAETLDPDAALIGVDDERFYLMNEGLQSYWIKADHARHKTNNTDPGNPKHAGALLLDGQILAITSNRNEASGRLRLFDTQHLDTQGTYEIGDFFDPLGGRLYRFDNLIICIDQSQITALRLDVPDPN